MLENTDDGLPYTLPLAAANWLFTACGTKALSGTRHSPPPTSFSELEFRVKRR